METSNILHFSDITYCDTVSQPIGLLKLTENAIGFKQKVLSQVAESKPLIIPKEEVAKMIWYRITPIKFMIKVLLAFFLSQ